MNQYRIRKATLQDIPAVERLHVQLMRYEKNILHFCSDPRWPMTKRSRTYRKENLRSPNGFIEVAEVNQRIVGFAQGYVAKSQPWRVPTVVAEMSLMFVLPRYRSQGIGRAFMQHFHDFAKKKKARRLALIVVSKNTQAIRLYKKYRFQEYFMNMEREM